MDEKQAKNYYRRNKEAILKKQHERYDRIKDSLKKQYADAYFICKCGKQVSSLRTELHNKTVYHKTRTYEP